MLDLLIGWIPVLGQLPAFLKFAVDVVECFAVKCFS
jgi:hypothetical protein